MRRREVLGAALMAPLAPASGSQLTCSDGTPGTVLLLHGASHGGWCWRDVAAVLRGAGYRVFAPTLTGLGERVHLRSPQVNLDTHVQDILNVMEFEELEQVTLVAHSYGGSVATAVCDRRREKIARVIFLDANVPRNGEATIPGLTREQAEAFSGKPLKEGYLLPPLDPLRVGVNPQDKTNLAWLRRRLTEHPLDTVAQPVELKHGGTDGMPRSFVLTTAPEVLQPFARKRMEEIRGDPSWDYYEMLVGHEAMIVAPTETAKLLIRIMGASE